MPSVPTGVPSGCTGACCFVAAVVRQQRPARRSDGGLSARELATQSARRTTGALITDMSQPLSEMIGNTIEVREVIEVLGGVRPGRFRDLCI